MDFQTARFAAVFIRRRTCCFSALFPRVSLSSLSKEPHSFFPLPSSTFNCGFLQRPPPWGCLSWPGPPLLPLFFRSPFFRRILSFFPSKPYFCDRVLTLLHSSVDISFSFVTLFVPDPTVSCGSVLFLPLPLFLRRFFRIIKRLFY